MARQELTHVPISKLQPDLSDTSDSKVSGLVTLIWPYSSITKTISLLLVEPDFRLRARRGQVRVVFKGASAKAITKAGITSGDSLVLSLKGIDWQKDESTFLTPGKGIEWELHYADFVDLQLQRESGETIPLLIEHSVAADTPSRPSSPTDISFFNSHISTSVRPPRFAPINGRETWFSPAFLKRDQSAASRFDALEDDDDFPDNARRKKAKFGRASNQWRFAEKTPSPEKDSAPVEMQIETPSKEPPSVGYAPFASKSGEGSMRQATSKESEGVVEEADQTVPTGSETQDQSLHATAATESLEIGERPLEEILVEVDVDKPLDHIPQRLETALSQYDSKLESAMHVVDRGSKQVSDVRRKSVISISSSVSSSSSEGYPQEEHEAALKIFEAGRSQPLDDSTSKDISEPTVKVARHEDAPREQHLRDVSPNREPSLVPHQPLSQAQFKEQSAAAAILDAGKLSNKDEKENSVIPSQSEAARPGVTDRQLLDTDQVHPPLSAEESDVETPGTSSIASDISKIGNEDLRLPSKQTQNEELETISHERAVNGTSLTGIAHNNNANAKDVLILDTSKPIADPAEEEKLADNDQVHLPPAKIDNGGPVNDSRIPNAGEAQETSTAQVIHAVNDMPTDTVLPQVSPPKGSVQGHEVHLGKKSSPPVGLDQDIDKLDQHERISNEGKDVDAKTAVLDGHPEVQSQLTETNLELPDTEPQSLNNLPTTIPDSVAISVKDQLPTPTTTQKTSFVSHASNASLKTLPEEETLPSPRLTQESMLSDQRPATVPETQDAGVLQESDRDLQGEKKEIDESSKSSVPILPTRKPTLIERLRAMRKASQESPKPRLSSSPAPASPWFAPRGSSTTVPTNEAEDDDGESLPDKSMLPRKPFRLAATPEKQLHESFIRSSPTSSEAGSPASTQYAPQSQPVPGLRTSTSYYVPLYGLSSHFDTLTDILALAVSASKPVRATGGPRDWHQSIYLTDGSLLQHHASRSPAQSDRKAPLINAQILRPKRTSLPEIEPTDAVLLRDFKVKFFQKRIALVSTASSSWAVFRQGTEPQVKGPPIEFGPEERGFARLHWQWWSRLSDKTRDRIMDAVPSSQPAVPSSLASAAMPQKKTSPATEKLENGLSTSTIRDGAAKRDKRKGKGIQGVGVNLPGSRPHPSSTFALPTRSPLNDEDANRGTSSRKKPAARDLNSTQALAKEWATGVIPSSEAEDDDGANDSKPGMGRGAVVEDTGGKKQQQQQKTVPVLQPSITRKALRPRDARGKTKSVSPEKEDLPVPAARRAGTQQQQPQGRGRGRRGRSVDV